MKAHAHSVGHRRLYVCIVHIQEVVKPVLTPTFINTNYYKAKVAHTRMILKATSIMSNYTKHERYKESTTYRQKQTKKHYSK